MTSPTGTVVCPNTQCQARIPFLPNLNLRRAALMGIAELACPHCLTVHRWRPEPAQYEVWRSSKDRWSSDLFRVVAEFRMDVALAGDRVAELMGGTDA